MDTIAEYDGKHYRAIAVERGGFIPPIKAPPFCCLIWDHDGRSSDAERVRIASVVLDAGCRYVVCGGQHCSTWHDAVDDEWWARYLEAPPEVQSAAHVMTTWHEGEGPDEVAFFFVNCTSVEGIDFRQYLVLHVGSGPLTDALDAAVRKYALNETWTL